jgi:hypothetical protein
MAWPDCLLYLNSGLATSDLHFFFKHFSSRASCSKSLEVLLSSINMADAFILGCAAEGIKLLCNEAVDEEGTQDFKKAIDEVALLVAGMFGTMELLPFA